MTKQLQGSNTLEPLIKDFHQALRAKEFDTAIAIAKRILDTPGYPLTIKNYSQKKIAELAVSDRAVGSLSAKKDGSKPGRDDVKIYIDNVSIGLVSGWAWSPKFPHASIELILIIDDAIRGASTASIRRHDLIEAGVGSGCYGFSLRFDEKHYGNQESFQIVAVIDNVFGGFFKFKFKTPKSGQSNHLSDRDKLYLLERDQKVFTSQGLLFENAYNYSQLPSNSFKDQLLVIAFYLPQFHSTPVNDKVWGKGFTEWRQLPRALPRFPGHYQPRIPRDLGFYNLLDEKSLDIQSKLAADAGISALCFYYYCFGRDRVLNEPLDAYASKRTEANTRFLIMWANENWTKTWDGLNNNVILAQDYLEKDEEWIIADMAAYLSNPNYVTLDGRPLLIIYRPHLIPQPKETMDRWRHIFKCNHDLDPLLFCVLGFECTDPYEVGFDGAIEFPPHKLAASCSPKEVISYMPNFKGTVIEYDDFIGSSLHDTNSNSFPLIKTLVPSWDNEPRRPGSGYTLANSSPFKFQVWLTQLLERALNNPIYGSSIVAINAWNEWAESAYLEPDVHYGSAYINSCYRSLSQLEANRKKVRSLPNCKLSVILPCFNHAKFLPERIQSILTQTIPPSEIVFLDDSSTDNSVEVAKKLFEDCSIPFKIIVNDQNSGCVFKQWIKGLRNCSHDLVWIAETDDSCDSTFLENILPNFDSELIRGVMGNISYISETGTPLSDLNGYYSDLLFHTWHAPFTIAAAKSFMYDFSVCNVIPNASGFVFRKPLLTKEEEKILVDLSFSGDWVFYAYLLRGGSMAYEPRAKSYFRKIESSASRSIFGTDKHMYEHCKVVSYLSNMYGLNEIWLHAHALRISPFFSDIEIIDVVKRLRPDELLPKPLKICIAAHSFSIGGGEVVPLQIANYLRSLGHHVTYLLLERCDDLTKSLKSRLRADIPVVYLDEVEYDINGFIKDFGFDLINSHNFGVEYHFCRLHAEISCKWISSLHGGHETVESLLTPMYIAYVSKYVDDWLYLSEKNITVLAKAGLPITNFKRTINGVDLENINWVDPEIFKNQHGVEYGDFSLVLCSRAIPEKGWKIAIDVVRQINTTGPNCHLFLIGDGPIFDEMNKYTECDTFIHLLGIIDSPIRLFKSFDMAIFPSTYNGETFPMFLVESISAGLPVIATSIGDIPNIVSADNQEPAGILVNWEQSDTDLSQCFCNEIINILNNSDKFEALRSGAALASRRFSVENQVNDLLQCAKVSLSLEKA